MAAHRWRRHYYNSIIAIYLLLFFLPTLIDSDHITPPPSQLFNAGWSLSAALTKRMQASFLSGNRNMYRRRSRNRHYDAFVSFRGKNSRETFISYLICYFTMSDPPIDAFFDTRIEGGEDIARELRQSLENSKMYVIVFSKNFAESKWCLWELAEIVDAARLKGKQILPIFYGVTRDDVRLGTDLYKEQLSHYSEAVKKRWTEAFQFCAEIEGLEWNPKDPDELGDGSDLCLQTLERVKEMIGTKEKPVNLQLTIRSLPMLTSLEGLDSMPASYKTLVIEDCMVLQSLPSQSGLENIQQLTILDCDGLKDIPHLGQLLSLKVLRIENCMQLVTLHDLSSLGQLEQLYILNCPELIEVIGLSMLVSLQELYISNCKSLTYVDIDVSKPGNVLEQLTFDDCENLSRLGKPDCDDNDNNTHDHPSSYSSDEECSTSFTDHADAKVGITRLPVSSEVSASSTEQEISEQLNSLISINDRENSRYHGFNDNFYVNLQHSPKAEVASSSSSVMLNEQIPTSVGAEASRYPDSGETNHLTNKASTDREEYSRSTCTPPTLDASVFSPDQAVAEVATSHHSEGLETFCEGPCDAEKAAACAFLQKFICMIRRTQLQMPIGYDHESVAAAIQIVLPSKGTTQNPKSSEVSGEGPGGGTEEEQPRPNK